MEDCQKLTVESYIKIRKLLSIMLTYPIDNACLVCELNLTKRIGRYDNASRKCWKCKRC